MVTPHGTNVRRNTAMQNMYSHKTELGLLWKLQVCVLLLSDVHLICEFVVEF